MKDKIPATKNKKRSANDTKDDNNVPKKRPKNCNANNVKTKATRAKSVNANSSKKSANANNANANNANANKANANKVNAKQKRVKSKTNTNATKGKAKTSNNANARTNANANKPKPKASTNTANVTKNDNARLSAKKRLFSSDPHKQDPNDEHGEEWKGKVSPFASIYVLGKKRTRVTYRVCYEAYLPKAKLNHVPIESVNAKTGKKTSRLESQWAAGKDIAGRVQSFTATKVKSKLPMNPKK